MPQPAAVADRESMSPLPDTRHHPTQRRERLLHERQPELLHRLEVSVERRRHDAGMARDLAQADLA